MVRTLLPALLLLSATTAAWAHVPHDPAYWVAFSPGEAPEWVVTTLPVHVRDSLLLVRTQDQQNVDLRYAINSDEGISAAAMLSDTRLVAGTAGRGLWISDDAGDGFAVHPDIQADATIHQIVASPDILTDGLAFAIGMAPLKDGSQLGLIWRSQDGGDSWQQVAGLPDVIPWDIKLSPTFGLDGRAFMVDRDGTVYRTVNSGNTFLEAGGVDGLVFEVAVGPEGRAWLATDSQGLWRSDDDGESFEYVGYDDKQIVTVAEFEGDLVMFTFADEAVWVSNDGGTNFTLVQNDIEDAAPGQPSDGVHYYELRQDGSGTIWLAAWEGLIKSRPTCPKPCATSA